MSVSASDSSTCALMVDGQARCWGRSDSGQLGNGSTAGFFALPVVVRNEQNTGPLLGLTWIGAGAARACALIYDGTARCWGAGPLGDGSATQSSLPVAVRDETGAGVLHGIAAVSVGDHSCVILDTGEARCWGSNLYGKLGDGTTVDRRRPTPVVGGDGHPYEGFATISAGSVHTCATLSSGQARCWGYRSYLMNGNLFDWLTPSTVLSSP